MRIICKALLVAAGAMALAGCSKEPGVGGKAEIRGRVYAVEYDNNTGQPVDSFYLAEARVYIVYGDHEFYDDDTRTGPDGLYQFSWLRKGEYRVYTYSECPLCPGDVQVVSADVSVSDRKEQVEVPDLRVQVWH